MFPGSPFDAFVYFQLVVYLLAHRCGLYENLERDIATIAAFTVSEGVARDNQNLKVLVVSSHSISRASHTVELAPNPSFPTTWYRSLSISPIRVG